MERRPLGNTGLTLPVLSFGASSLGRSFAPSISTRRCGPSTSRWTAGMNFIDTSPFYGRGMSDSAARRRPAAECRATATCLCSKTRPLRLRPLRLLSQARRGERGRQPARHGRPAPRHYLLHDIEFVDMAQIVEETLPALRKVQQQGKVRFVGVSGYPMKIFRYVLDGRRWNVMLSYTITRCKTRCCADLVPYLKAKGVGIMNAAPFSARLLTNARAAAVAQATPEVRGPAARRPNTVRRRAWTSPSDGLTIFDPQ